MEEVDAYAMFYFDCPKCNESNTDGISDGDFYASGVAADGGAKEICETECEHCEAKFIVVKP
jgi:hypothetical protein